MLGKRGRKRWGGYLHVKVEGQVLLRESFFCGRSSGFSALERSKDVCLAPEDAQLTVSLIGLSLNTDNV